MFRSFLITEPILRLIGKIFTVLKFKSKLYEKSTVRE